jgi:hypothetical protein
MICNRQLRFALLQRAVLKQDWAVELPEILSPER